MTVTPEAPGATGEHASTPGATGPAVMDAAASDTTFPQLLADLAEQRPKDVAMQEKRYGIWAPVTWAEYHQRVTDFAHGLGALGLDRGDIVAVIGDNRPEWLIAELAAQSLGGAVVGVYPTSIGAEIVHILTTARVRVVVAEDQEQVDKLIRLKPELPLVEAVVYYDPHGLEHYDEPYLRQFADVAAAGQAWAEANPGWLEERHRAAGPEDVAVICTTSGTTARPKLGELSHRNLLSMAANLTQIDPLDPGVRYVSFLPFAWIGEQMLAVACGLTVGFTLSFPDDASTQRADLREIGPDVMFSPPRIWESLLSEVQVRIDDADWLKRRVFGWGYAVGDRHAERRVRGARAGVLGRASHALADALVLRPVRDQLGLARMRRCYTGGAPLAPDVFRFFHAIGVNLKQIYGQTEICGIAVAHRDGHVKFGTVGAPIPGTDLRISESGEILLRSAAIFRGYHANPQATAEAVDQDGWLHTGDAGYLDEDEHLVVIDRAKDVYKAPDGSLFSSAFIENKLKFSPYVEEAVAFRGTGGTGGTGGENIVTAIVTVDPQTVGAWAEHQRVSYTTYTDLAQKPEVYDLLAEEVGRANTGLPEPVRVRRFVLLHKQFDPDDDEITRTRKIRRGVITERYADIVAALERGDPQVRVASVVRYQDGTKAQRDIPLRIHDLARTPAPADAGRRPIWSGRR